VVARQEGVGAESLRRWVVQAEIDAGQREGTTSEELAEIRRLKAENRRLREGRGDLESGDVFLRGGARPPQPVLVGFIDMMRGEGRADGVGLSGPAGAGRGGRCAYLPVQVSRAACRPGVSLMPWFLTRCGRPRGGL